MPECHVNGFRMVYEQHGDTGPPVLLIPGAHPAKAWQPAVVPALLESGYRVITFDHRGISPSEGVDPPYSVEDLATDVSGLLDELGIGPCHVIGNSVGGVVSQTLALTEPQRVRSVCFLAGLGKLSPAGRILLDALFELYETSDPLPAIQRSLFTTLFVPPPYWSEPDEGVAQLDRLITESWSGREILGHISALRDSDGQSRSAELGGLRVPALGVAGRWDQLFPPTTFRESMALVPNGAYTEIPDAAHILLARGEQVCERVLSFLQEVDAEQRSARGVFP